MSNEAIFADRIKRINKTAKKSARKRGRKRGGGGTVVVMPLMMALFMAGGVVMAWEVMDRPTDTPFQMAGDLTARMFSN